MNHGAQTLGTERNRGPVRAARTAPRRVLVIVENLPVPLDRRVWQEATALAAAGYQVTVICPKGRGCEASHEVLDGIHVYRHPLPRERRGAAGYLLEYGAALFWESALTLRVALTRGFDVIHACNPPDLIALVAAPYKLLGKRFLFDHHDLNPELYTVKFGRRRALHRILLGLERLTFALADVTIATNDSYRRIATGRGRMPAERVFVVRSSPDAARFRSTAPPPDTGRPRTGVTVGYVGIMGDQDGVDGLLRVASRIVHQHRRDDVRFVLIGDGPELSRLKRLAGELGLSRHVEFTGFLTGDALMARLAAIDIGAAPDPRNDYTDKCTTNKIMEYMAMGKPTVQYELTEGRVSAGDTALYAKPGNEAQFAERILDLADDPERRRALGRRARERFETTLHWRLEIPNLLAAYETVFAGRRLRTS